MYSGTRHLNPVVSGTGTGYSTDVYALNNAESVGFGVEWPAGISAGAYTLEFIPSKDYSGTGATVIGPFAAPTAAQYDCEAVGVAAKFCRVRRTVGLTGTGTPVLHLFIRQ
jgi:hypothetical protein